MITILFYTLAIAAGLLVLLAIGFCILVAATHDMVTRDDAHFHPHQPHDPTRGNR